MPTDSSLAARTELSADPLPPLARRPLRALRAEPHPTPRRRNDALSARPAAAFEAVRARANGAPLSAPSAGGDGGVGEDWNAHCPPSLARGEDQRAGRRRTVIARRRRSRSRQPTPAPMLSGRGSPRSRGARPFPRAPDSRPRPVAGQPPPNCATATTFRFLASRTPRTPSVACGLGRGHTVPSPRRGGDAGDRVAQRVTYRTDHPPRSQHRGRQGFSGKRSAQERRHPRARARNLEFYASDIDVAGQIVEFQCRFVYGACGGPMCSLSWSSRAGRSRQGSRTTPHQAENGRSRRSLATSGADMADVSGLKASSRLTWGPVGGRVRSAGGEHRPHPIFQPSNGDANHAQPTRQGRGQFAVRC